MSKKATKATRKFAASGQLKKTIQQRRKVQDFNRKAERRRAGRKGKERKGLTPAEDEEQEDEVEETSGKWVV